MRVLLVTVAGSATRFNKDFKKPVLKCLYHESSIYDSMLYQLLEYHDSFDKVVIVGGFLFDQLKETVERDFQHLSDKIILVYNRYYHEYGSGYSLFLGVMAVKDISAAEIVFTEGDLFVDQLSFDLVIECPKNVVTINFEPITAKKSVVFYINSEGKIHYIYDLDHNNLYIKESFTAIYNSAQIWKIKDVNRLCECMSELTEEEHKGTNLVLIEKYFERLDAMEYEIMPMELWYNCNTADDYRKAVHNRRDNNI